MLKSWGLTSWKKWRISPVTSDWVCLPQFPYHMKFRSMQFSYNFLYLYIHLFIFFWIPLCPIYIVIHLGAAQYNHNLTTDHWAALLEWLGIRCFAQGQLVAFGRQETISYLTSPPPPPQPFFFSFTSHSTQYFLFSFVPFHFHFQKVLLHLWERQWFYTSTLQRTCSEIPVKGLSPGPAPLPSPTTTS